MEGGGEKNERVRKREKVRECLKFPAFFVPSRPTNPDFSFIPLYLILSHQIKPPQFCFHHVPHPHISIIIPIFLPSTLIHFYLTPPVDRTTFSSNQTPHLFTWAPKFYPENQTPSLSSSFLVGSNFFLKNLIGRSVDFAYSTDFGLKSTSIDWFCQFRSIGSILWIYLSTSIYSIKRKSNGKSNFIS